MHFATRSHIPSANKRSLPIAVNAKDEEFCSFTIIQSSQHCVCTNEPGLNGANVGRCFSLRVIIPLLIADRCFGFIQGRESDRRYIEGRRRHDAVSSGELTSDPSYLDCSDIIPPRLLTACLSFSFSHYTIFRSSGN